MKLIRPNSGGIGASAATGAGASRRIPTRTPKWLQERIEDRGIFVLLSCGHKENINDRAVTVIAQLSGTRVLCERCNYPVTVVRHLKFREYADLPPPREDSPVPLF